MIQTILRAGILNSWIVQFRFKRGVKLKKIPFADRDQSRIVVKSVVLPRKMRR